MEYIAIIHKAADSDYLVSFPDFPGYAAFGVSLEEARSKGRKTLLEHLRALLDAGQTLPPAMSLDAVMEHEDFSDGVAFFVSAPQRRGKSVRVNIMLPEADLQAIDACARAEGMSRSSFLLRAARASIGMEKN